MSGRRGGEQWSWAGSTEGEEFIGKVVALGAEAFIVCSDTAGSRDFELVDRRGKGKLIPPYPWRIEEAVVYGDGFLSACLHPELGYGLWAGGDVWPVEGEITLFSMSGEAPIIYQTGSRLGSRWSVWETIELGGALESDDTIRVEHLRLGCMPCVWIRSNKDCGSLVVSLHGGPDSNEGDSLRYGGLYRKLANEGIACLVVNYPGSRGYGSSFQRRAWQNWDGVAREARHELARFVGRQGYSSVRVFGVSFGAWLALQLASPKIADLTIDRIVCASPVLDLAGHIRAHWSDSVFREWAHLRFGDTLKGSVEPALETSFSEVHIIIPSEDEVVDPKQTRDACANMGWTVHDVVGGHYPIADIAMGRWRLIRALLEPGAGRVHE